MGQWGRRLRMDYRNGLPKRSNISVEFYDLGFRVKSPGDLNDKKLDSALEFLHSRVVEQEKAQLIQVICFLLNIYIFFKTIFLFLVTKCIYNGLSLVAFNSFRFVFDSNESEKRSDQI